MKAIEVYGKADYWDFARARGGHFDRRRLPQAPDQQRYLLWLEGEQVVAARAEASGDLTPSRWAKTGARRHLMLRPTRSRPGRLRARRPRRSQGSRPHSRRRAIGLASRRFGGSKQLPMAGSFSVISLTADRDRSRLPVSSVNASSMSRVDRPRA